MSIFLAFMINNAFSNDRKIVLDDSFNTFFLYRNSLIHAWEVLIIQDILYNLFLKLLLFI